MASIRAPSGDRDALGERAVRLLRLPTDDDSLIADMACDGAFAIEPIAGDEGYATLTAKFRQEKLIISVSTETAFRCALSRAVAAALSRRLTIAEDDLCDLEIAVQEAIGNAVLHGNLALPTIRESDPAALEARITEVQNRLQDAALARRRVTIACDWDFEAVSIAVYDEGTGFSAALLPEAVSPAEDPQSQSLAGGGRGLKMIRRLARSLEIDEKNCCVRMTFPLGDKTAARRERS